MDKVVCKNVFVSDSVKERNKVFNEVWQNVVNLMINR